LASLIAHCIGELRSPTEACGQICGSRCRQQSDSGFRQI